MKRQPPQLDLSELGRSLAALGMSGFIADADPAVCDLLIAAGLCVASPSTPDRLLATNHLFALGTTRDETSALRRVLSLVDGYRAYLLG